MVVECRRLTGLWQHSLKVRVSVRRGIRVDDTRGTAECGKALTKLVKSRRHLSLPIGGIASARFLLIVAMLRLYFA